RVLRLAFRALQRLSALCKLGLGSVVFGLDPAEGAARGFDFGTNACNRLPALHEAPISQCHLRLNLAELGANLRRALFKALQRLAQLEPLDLGGMLVALQRGDPRASGFER